VRCYWYFFCWQCLCVVCAREKEGRLKGLCLLLCPHPVGGAGALSGDRRPSSVRLSVCLMSRTSALTRKPKGLGRRNFAQGYPGHMRLPHRLQGQKSRWGGGILWRPPSRTTCFTSYACTLVFSEVVHCFVPELASSVIPTLARTRGPGALRAGSSGLSQI